MKAFFILDSNLEIVPHDQATLNYMARRKEGEVIVAEIKRARNYENHKRYFSFLQLTFDMQEHFDEFESYRYWLTMKCGWFDTVVAPNGATMFKPRSISFESMDEDEFKRMFSRAIDVFLKELGEGISEKSLMKVINYG